MELGTIYIRLPRMFHTDDGGDVSHPGGKVGCEYFIAASKRYMETNRQWREPNRDLREYLVHVQDVNVLFRCNALGGRCAAHHTKREEIRTTK